MTAAIHVRRAAAANLGLVTRLWRWIKNTIFECLFGQSELQRICGSKTMNDQERMLRFRTSLALSNALVTTCNAVFDFEAFQVDKVTQDVALKGKVNGNDIVVMQNLRSCLHRCNFVNQTYARMFALKDQPYDSTNNKHEEMLEQLWSNLKPNVRRTGGRITKEWGEIGFQGSDPMTDFRGMGILSLKQLGHFTSKYPVEAQRALADSNHPTRWYPFSVAGINVTGFMIDLIRERLLDHRIYRFADVRNPQSEVHFENGMMALHDVYADIFTRFNKLWVDCNPRDAMAFPIIFQSLKDAVRTELQTNAFQY